MQKRSRSIVIISVLLAYIIFQFLWWEILLVRQTTEIISERQKLTELSTTDAQLIARGVNELHHKKKMRIYMIVGEGTVFLLLLLAGVYKVKQYYDRETALAGQQKNFLLSITHELKTPVAATKLQLQTLQKHQLDKETEQELIANALRETERLNKLIDNVLLASRIENEQISLHKENVNASVLTASILNTYFGDRVRRGELKYDTGNDLHLLTDPVIFPSLLINLVENAVKYSFGQVDVRVDLERKDNGVQLSVADQGCGISDREKTRIFDRFYRVGSEEVRSTKGTGIGLYLVKQIADAHGTSLEVKDNTPQGTVFTIIFKA